MDKKIIQDLSDPSPSKPLSKKDHLLRRWHLALSIYAASMIYAVLHKAAIPFALNVLGTSRKEYAHVSYSVIWVAILGVTLHKEQEVSDRVQLFMGAALGFAVLELALIFFESRSGWMLFSHLLAGIPLICSIVFLLKFATEKKWKLLFSGAGVFAATEGLLWKLTL